MDASSRRKFFQQQCQPVFTEYQLMREFVLFQQQTIPNIYVVPSNSSAFKWYGVIFIHHGIYKGAILRFTLLIPQDYPCNEVPKVVFETVPFHPLINPKTGVLSTTRDFPTWSSANQLWQLIWLAKKVFTRVEKDLKADCEYSSLNSSYDLGDMFFVEAVKMYKEDNEKFILKVSETIANCHAGLYEPPADSHDQNAILFSPWSPELHEDLRKKLVTGQAPLVDKDEKASGSRSGLSWVKKDSMQMFSKSAI